MSTLASLQLNSAYEDLQQMVFYITQNFARTFSLQFDDLIGEAHVIFTKEYQRFDPEKGTKLSSWLYTKIWFGLMSFMRKELRHHHLDNVDDLQERSCNPNLFLSDLRGSLSEEANAIVSLILDTPRDFELLLCMNRANSRQRVLATLREHLGDSGWDDDDVERHITEITCVMSDAPVPVEPPAVGSFWDEGSERVLARVGITRAEVRALLS